MKHPDDSKTVELPLLDAMGQPFADWVTPKRDPRTFIVRSGGVMPLPGLPAMAPGKPPGDNFRERERLKRKAARWTAKLRNMPALERAFIRQALACIDETGEGA